MKHLDPAKFDEILFDYFEGNLSLGDQQQLFDLMEKDPSLKVEFDAWASTYSLSNEPKSAYPNTNDLLVAEKAGYQGWFVWGASVLVVLIGLYGLGNFFLSQNFAYVGPDKRLNQLSELTEISNNNTAAVLADEVEELKKQSLSSSNSTSLSVDKTSVINQHTNRPEQIESSESSASVLPVNSVDGTTTEEDMTGNLSTTPAKNATTNAPSNQGDGNLLENNRISTDYETVNIDRSSEKQTDKGKIEIEKDKNTKSTRPAKGHNAKSAYKEIASNNSNESEYKERERNKKLEEVAIKDDKIKSKNMKVEDPTKLAKEQGPRTRDSELPRFEPSNHSGVQDPSFVRSSSSPMVLNPAFVGTMQCSRFSSNYRYQQTATGQSFYTVHAAFDKYVPAIRGGVGMVAYYDNLANGAVETKYAGMIYSPKFEIEADEKISIEPALQVGYTTMRYDWDKIEKAGYTDPRHGFNYTSNATQDVTNSGFVDVAGGIVVKSKQLFGGLAVDHITQSKKNQITNAYIPRRFTGHVGYNIQKRNDSHFSATPSIQFTKQASLFQLMWSSTFRYKSIVGGVGFANQDWLILMAGYQVSQFRISYSYDASVSSLGDANSTAHEISLRYLFGCNEKPSNSSYLLSKAY